VRHSTSSPKTRRDQAIAATRAVMLPEVLDATDLAYWLRCSRTTARRLLRAGVIPGRRVGRQWFVTRAALLDALESPRGASGPRLSVVPEDGVRE
jgi:excisionase family DNA binding protein